MSRHRSLILVLIAGLLCVLALPGTADAADRPLPVSYKLPKALAASLFAPGSSPPGANDWGCRPSAAHPEPVVLVHGTVENMRINWNALSPLLKNEGYCVFALDFGGVVLGQFRGVNSVPSSAAELSTFVDRVLAATGAQKVDIVGHSQGGMMPRYYINLLGGDQKVDNLVGLVPSNHGTTVFGIATLVNLIPGVPAVIGAAVASGRDQITGSPFNATLAASGETRPGVTYTVITTRYDEVVTPYRSAFLSGPNVTNIVIQDGCLTNGAEHVSIAYDRRALTHVLNALDPANPKQVPCTVSVPLVGS
jgi:triacylglycerol esterase/lipase EstA (alpha/beta hydrolase family)